MPRLSVNVLLAVFLADIGLWMSCKKVEPPMGENLT